MFKLYFFKWVKNNLCYYLEYDESRFTIGSIKGTYAHKQYPIWKSNNIWKINYKNNKFETPNDDEALYIIKLTLSEIESIFKIINDCIKNKIDIFDTLSEKENNSYELLNKSWFRKYLHLSFPNIFPPFYTRQVISKILKMENIQESRLLMTNLKAIRNHIKKWDCHLLNITI